MAEVVQSAWGRRDPEEGVGRAERRSGRGQHDPRDDEEDDAAERACAENQRHHNGDRRDDEGPKTAIECAHIAGHRGLLPFVTFVTKGRTTPRIWHRWGYRSSSVIFRR